MTLQVILISTPPSMRISLRTSLALLACAAAPLVATDVQAQVSTNAFNGLIGTPFDTPFTTSTEQGVRVTARSGDWRVHPSNGFGVPAGPSIFLVGQPNATGTLEVTRADGSLFAFWMLWYQPSNNFGLNFGFRGFRGGVEQFSYSLANVQSTNWNAFGNMDERRTAIDRAEISYTISRFGGNVAVDLVSTTRDFDPPTTTVPEPATYVTLGAGLLAVGAVARRRARV